MRIRGSQREQNTNLAKCSKMTEDGPRIYGMNGVTNNGSPLIKEECPENKNNYTQGGRLKFFKDGKFILELARAREGEKCAWVPVPKKTFWPPQGSASSLSQYRQESSTSLSVSDDNSSVQSSPWQRDHTWKQTSPVRNASHHLSFFYRGRWKKPKCMSYMLRRCPYAIIPQQTSSEQTERTKCIKGKQCNRCVSVHHKKVSLMQVVQILWNKSLPTPNNITSPRKRILKELERVTIDDLSLKRSKGKVNQSAQPASTVSQQQQPQQVTAETVTVSTAETNGNNVVEETKAAAATSSKNCSYSINSLLKNDKKDEKLSSQFVPVHRMTHHKEPSYDTVDSHRIDVINTNNKRSPVHAAAPEYAVSTGYHPYVPPYMYPGVLGPGYIPTSYYTSAYGRSSYLHALPTLPPTTLPHTRHNGATVYSPWPSHQYQPPPITARDETISDVPLNLSKHAD